MDHLFSPWRSTYIQTFSEKKRPRTCLFCRIARETSDSDNLVVWRGEHCYVLMNRYPYNSGHLMIVPYRHTARFVKLSEKENNEIMTVLAKCITALEHISKPHGFNFGANLGRVAGAGIDKHVHFHLVPRWNGDTNFMAVLGNVKIISEDMKNSCSKIKSALTQLNTTKQRKKKLKELFVHNKNK